MYKLSARSKKILSTVDVNLQIMVRDAIRNTLIDFAVIEGFRTAERQSELYRLKASRVKVSKHQSGQAVDLMAYVDGRPCWEPQIYPYIAAAMAESSDKYGRPIRWGGCWTERDIRGHSSVSMKKTKSLMNKLMLEYIKNQREKGRAVYVDGPHFELM